MRTAQSYANKCINQHDYEGLENMHKGQGENIGYIWYKENWGRTILRDPEMTGLFSELADNWPNKEYTYFNNNATFYPNEPEMYINDPKNTDFWKRIADGGSHYTQMTWADTTELGCGVAYCNTLLKKDGVSFVELERGYGVLFAVCRYRSAGNSARQFFDRTFDPNLIASACPGEVEDGLCISADGEATEAFENNLRVPSGFNFFLKVLN